MLKVTLNEYNNK